MPKDFADPAGIVDSAVHLFVAAELIYEHAIPAVRAQWDEVIDPVLELRTDTRPDLGDWSLPWLDFAVGNEHSSELPLRTEDDPGGSQEEVTVGASQDRSDGRLKDMDAEGIETVILHPAEFSYAAVAIEDPLSAAILEAYNDFVARYCARETKRLKASVQLHGGWPPWAVRQLDKHAASEHVVAASLCLPNSVPLDDSSLEPVYKAVEGSGLPLVLSLRETEGMTSSARAAAAKTLIDTYIAAGIPERHPALRVAVVNGGCQFVSEVSSGDPVAVLARSGRLGIMADLRDGLDVMALAQEIAGPNSLMWASGFPIHTARLGAGNEPFALSDPTSFLKHNAQRFFLRRSIS